MIRRHQRFGADVTKQLASLPILPAHPKPCLNWCAGRESDRSRFGEGFFRNLLEKGNYKGAAKPFAEATGLLSQSLPSYNAIAAMTLFNSAISFRRDGKPEQVFLYAQRSTD